MPADAISMPMYRYEHVEALFDGRVELPGVQVRQVSVVTDAFQQLARREVDAAEFGLTYFLRTWDTAERPFLALPLVMNRHFRHASVFVRSNAGIERPEDLNGRRIGEFGLYGHDAGVWPKGILADEHGFDPTTCEWVVGGTNFPLPPFSWIPQPVPPSVRVRHTEGEETLGAMLEDGEIDALISVDVPRAVVAGSTAVRRLFPDYERVEQDWFRRTGIHPPAHVLAISRELADDEELVRAIYGAFVASKDLALERYRQDALKHYATSMFPWLAGLYERDRALLGDDLWPHGVRRNRVALDTYLRYHHEQGLSASLLTTDDIVVPALLDS